MIIRAELKCKQTGCEADTCAVDRKMHGAVERLREEYPGNVFASAFELPAFSALASLVFQNQGLQVF